MSANTTDGAETPQGDSSQALTYGDGMDRFDVPPEGVTPRMTADSAYDAWMNGGGHRPESSEDPETRFVLYTNFAAGQMLDSGLVAHSSTKRPAWIVRFTNVSSSASGGGHSRPVGGVTRTGPTGPPTTVVSDLVGVVDDTSGQAILTMNAKPDDPPHPWRSSLGSDRSSCPAALSGYAPGLVHDGETPLPVGSIAFTQPHAIVRGSNGDVYRVWGGAGSLEHPLSGPAGEEPDGVLVVMRDQADPCKSPLTDEGPIVFHHEPSRSGIVTITAISGDIVRYRTADGVTATYNVVTASFVAT